MPMSSPITGSSFNTVTAGQSFCDRLTNLLSLSSKLKLFFDWAFDSDGAATNEFRSMFLPPPGSVIAYYTSLSFDLAKTTVDKIDRPDGDTSTQGFWAICDGTNGTPDLRGRVILGAGQGNSLTNRPVGETGGSEGITLSADQMPPHKHQLKTPNGKGIPCWDDYVQEAGSSGNPTCGFSVAVGQLDTSPASNVLGYKGAQIMTEENTFSGDQNPVKPYPPYMALYYIMRTSRTA